MADVSAQKSRKGKEREPAQADLFDRLIAIQRSKARYVSLQPLYIYVVLTPYAQCEQTKRTVRKTYYKC